MHARLIADFQRGGKIADARPYAPDDVILSFPTQISIVEVDEIIVLDTSSRWSVRQHVPDGLIEASSYEAPLWKLQFTRGMEQSGNIGISVHNIFESTALTLLSH